MVRGVSNNNGGDPNPPPIPSDFDNIVINDAEYIDNTNGQVVNYTDNEGNAQQFTIQEPYPFVIIQDDIADLPITPDMVGRIYFWQGHGFYQLFDTDPRGLLLMLYTFQL